MLSAPWGPTPYRPLGPTNLQPVGMGLPQGITQRVPLEIKGLLCGTGNHHNKYKGSNSKLTIIKLNTKLPIVRYNPILVKGICK